MDYLGIYQNHALDYDRLVRAEDCDHNLLPAIQRIVPVRGAWVFEAGSGTGRISRLLTVNGAHVVGTDRAATMLDVARKGLDNGYLAQADARAVPVKAGWANLAIAGWVYGHFLDWYGDHWQGEIVKALAELERTLAPGGVTILV